MSGPPIPGREEFFVPGIPEGQRREGAGYLGIISFPAWDNWAFSPQARGVDLACVEIDAQPRT